MLPLCVASFKCGPSPYPIPLCSGPHPHMVAWLDESWKSSLSLCMCFVYNYTCGDFFGGGRGLLFVVVGGHFCRSLLCNHVLVV